MGSFCSIHWSCLVRVHTQRSGAAAGKRCRKERAFPRQGQQPGKESRGGGFTAGAQLPAHCRRGVTRVNPVPLLPQELMKLQPDWQQPTLNSKQPLRHVLMLTILAHSTPLCYLWISIGVGYEAYQKQEDLTEPIQQQTRTRSLDDSAS